MHAHVVAGIDGSPSSVAAAQYAADWAARCGYGLDLVHGRGYDEVPDDDALSHVAAGLAVRHPGLTVVCRRAVGGGPAVLVEESRSAELTVVGAHGAGTVATASLGATATTVATHARGPVVIARPPAALPDAAAPVLVGVDGSDHSAAALDFAFDIAAHAGAAVVAVHVWWAGPLASVADSHLLAQRTGQALSDALETWRHKYPDVQLTEKLVCSASAAQELIDESAGAGLVVVGTRGHGGFAGLLLGSVSLSVARDAHCPVAIVRPHEHSSDAGRE
jgi:nucleotide-binding universal stress UspA family protein